MKKSRSALMKQYALTIGLIGFLCFQYFSPTATLHWLMNNLIEQNLGLMFDRSKAITQDQKSQIKLGSNYFYLNTIKNTTPEDAIILFPDSETFKFEHDQISFSNEINIKGWASYFVYPRKIVYEREKNVNELYSQISHVAIVNGWGYHKLNYQVDQQIPFSVLAKNR